METKPAPADAQAGPDSAPILIDLGKKKADDVRKLRKGKGKLIRQVEEAIQGLQSAGTISSTAQPVIVVVTERCQGKGLLSMLEL
jgi:hypothetical protein